MMRHPLLSKCRANFINIFRFLFSMSFESEFLAYWRKLPKFADTLVAVTPHHSQQQTNNQ